MKRLAGLLILIGLLGLASLVLAEEKVLPNPPTPSAEQAVPPVQPAPASR